MPFTSDQRTVLMAVLGDKYEELLPVLEEKGVNAFRRRAAQGTDAGDVAAARIIRLASRVEKDVVRLLKTLEEVAACSTRDPSDADLKTLCDLFNEQAQNSIQTLLDEARRLKVQTAVPRKRGRKVGDRPFYAEWIGIRLAKAGVPLTRGADGPFARTMAIVYEASGIPVPSDMFRDVKYVWDFLQDHLKLPGMATTTQNKSKKRI